MTLNEIIAVHGLDKLNSATKYPSILTYHATGDKGTLKPELNAGVGFGSSLVQLTEKVDGTNARIIFDESGDFILGSREDLLYARGDRVWPPKDPILKELLGGKLEEALGEAPKNGVTVLFGEVYGEKINPGYARSNGFLLFDVFHLDLDVLARSVPEISLWREGGGQAFQPSDRLRDYAAVAPQVPTLHAEREGVPPPPPTLEGAFEYLREWLPASRLEGVGAPEGLIARTPDRKMIRKLRFQDYERTFKKLGQAK